MACFVCIAWPRVSKQATGIGATNQASGGTPGIFVGGMGLAGLIRIARIRLRFADFCADDKKPDLVSRAICLIFLV
ncbi:hypothetical protein, partial [Accumulibacter sp.]|uniref:hypothetical protein n=1 Tax=Accumulibacter sp. TaxID=2053492 RepID=UPI00260BC524